MASSSQDTTYDIRKPSLEKRSDMVDLYRGPKHNVASIDPHFTFRFKA